MEKNDDKLSISKQIDDAVKNGVNLSEVVITAKFPDKIKATCADGVSGPSGRGSLDSCFFYDRQLENELTSISLHPNTYTSDGGITWESCKSDLDSDGVYRATPICKAILDEDYQVATSNMFSDFGNDVIGETFNSFKPYVPYAAHFSKVLEEANRKEEQMKTSSNEEDRESINSNIGQFLDKFTDVMYSSVKEMPSLLNRNLVAQGARFSYYSGTGVGFGNLSMKFTVFSTWSNGKFITIEDQLKELYGYCFGKFVDLVDINTNKETGEVVTTITGTEIGTENKVIGNFLNENKDLINRYFMWQLPPGGYRASVKDIDEIQFGTLKLKIGTYYSVPNLVIENAQFQFSKQLIKVVKDIKTDNVNDIYPLYCDVSLTLRPVTKFTDVALINYISGNYTKIERECVEDELNKSLNKVKKDNV